MPEKEELVEVYLYCPECKQKMLVTADMYQVNRAQASILCDERGRCYIDWENMEIEGNFEYICDFCGTQLARSLDEVEQKFKEEQKKGKKK